MEYLPYSDLAGLRSADKHEFTGTLTDARDVLYGVASALSYLHSRSIYHNDIKPGNILFDPARGPILIDFGMASFDQKKRIGGTPWYIPREFMVAAPRGAKGDVFALGVTMLYLLRNISLPEKGVWWNIGNIFKEEGEDLMKMTTWLDRIQEIRNQIMGGNDNSDLEALVVGMLNNDPEERPTATQIVDGTGK